MQGASDTETQNGALGLCPSIRPCPLRRLPREVKAEGLMEPGIGDRLCLGGKTPGLLGVMAEDEVVLAARPLPW